MRRCWAEGGARGKCSLENGEQEKTTVGDKTTRKPDPKPMTPTLGVFKRSWCLDCISDQTAITEYGNMILLLLQLATKERIR